MSPDGISYLLNCIQTATSNLMGCRRNKELCIFLVFSFFCCLYWFGFLFLIYYCEHNKGIKGGEVCPKRNTDAIASQNIKLFPLELPKENCFKDDIYIIGVIQNLNLFSKSL